MKLPVLAAVAFALSLSALPSAVQGQETAALPTAAPAPKPFGSRGQLVLSTDLPLNVTQPALSLVYTSTTMGGGTTTSYGIQPSFDCFVASNVSLGGIVGVTHTKSSPDPYAGVPVGSPSSRTVMELGVRLGYNLVLNDAVSLWPRLGFTYQHTSLSAPGTRDASAQAVDATFFVPVLWHPGQHFFVGGGPIFGVQPVSKFEGSDTAQTTTVGLEVILGGYFGA